MVYFPLARMQNLFRSIFLLKCWILYMILDQDLIRTIEGFLFPRFVKCVRKSLRMLRKIIDLRSLIILAKKPDSRIDGRNPLTEKVWFLKP